MVSGTRGSYAPVSGSAPPGWTVWGSDGRIIPPPGLYRVTTTGVTVRKRTTDGNFVAVGDLVRINAGEAITPDYKTSEDVVMVEKVIPPPCVIARFWGGGRCGVKEDRQRAAYIWRQVAGRASRWGGHAPYRPASPRREVHTPSGVATSGEKRVRRNCWPGGSGQVATNIERGYGRFGVSHACGVCGVRDRNVHRRLTTAAAGGGGVNGFTQDWGANQTLVGQRAPGRPHHNRRVAPGPVFGRVYQSGLSRTCGGSFGSSRPGTHTNGVPAVHVLQLGRRVPPRGIRQRLATLETPTGHLATQAVV